MTFWASIQKGTLINLFSGTLGPVDALLHVNQPTPRQARQPAQSNDLLHMALPILDGGFNGNQKQTNQFCASPILSPFPWHEPRVSVCQVALAGLAIGCLALARIFLGRIGGAPFFFLLVFFLGSPVKEPLGAESGVNKLGKCTADSLPKRTVALQRGGPSEPGLSLGGECLLRMHEPAWQIQWGVPPFQ